MPVPVTEVSASVVKRKEKATDEHGPINSTNATDIATALYESVRSTPSSGEALYLCVLFDEMAKTGRPIVQASLPVWLEWCDKPFYVAELVQHFCYQQQD